MKAGGETGHASVYKSFNPWRCSLLAKIETTVQSCCRDYQTQNALGNAPLTENKRLELLLQLAESQTIPIEPASNMADINQQLVRQWPYDGNALRQLAIERSKSIKNHLVGQGVSPERVFILNAETTDQTRISTERVATTMEIKTL